MRLGRRVGVRVKNEVFWGAFGGGVVGADATARIQA